MIDNCFTSNLKDMSTSYDIYDLLSRQVLDSLSNVQLPAHQELTLSFVLGQSLQLGVKIPLPHETFTEYIGNEKEVNELSDKDIFTIF